MNISQCVNEFHGDWFKLPSFLRLILCYISTLVTTSILSGNVSDIIYTFHLLIQLPAMLWPEIQLFICSSQTIFNEVSIMWLKMNEIQSIAWTQYCTYFIYLTTDLNALWSFLMPWMAIVTRMAPIIRSRDDFLFNIHFT